jgi:hypothetical protein
MTSKLINNMGRKNNRGPKTAQKTVSEEDEGVPSFVEDITEEMINVDDKPERV